jgi:septal ring factor EnvC (AmiA/AmiB activator)
MALRSHSTAALRKELARREKGASKLQKKHGKLAKALAKLESELAGLGGIIIVSGKRRGRPPGSKNKKRRGKRLGRPPGSKNKKRRGRPPGSKNKQSLGDALAAAVRPGTVVSPAEAMSKVKAAGYKSAAKQFGIVVAMRLRDDKRFKRKGRGQYLRVGA